MHERVADRGRGIKLAKRSVWIGRNEGSSAVAIPLGDISGRNKASQTIVNR